MTTQKAIDLFNILQDKYGSPDVDPDEVVDFLNMATHEWLNRMMPSNLGGIVNFEFDSNILSNIKPLIFAVTATMDGSGILTNTVITTALQTAGAETGATWFRIANAGMLVSGEIYPVKFSKHNNILVNERNYFKKGSTTSPNYIIRQDGLKFYPTNITSNGVLLTIVKNPKTLSLTGPVNPEFDDSNMHNIIAIALKFAGIATRDEELLVDIRNTAIQTAQ